MTITKARSEKVLFSSPYYENALAVVYKDGTTVNSLDDLKGKKLPLNWGLLEQILHIKLKVLQ